MFDWKKPTVQMLGRWQPWHDGNQALFKRAFNKTGQVIIQVRDVHGASGGDGQDDNPFDWDEVCENIAEVALIFFSGQPTRFTNGPSLGGLGGIYSG